MAITFNNKGFEDAVYVGAAAYLDVTENWIKYPAPLGVGDSITLDTGTKHGGSQSAKFVRATTTSYMELYQVVEGIEANHRYTVSAWLKVDSGSSSVPDGIENTDYWVETAGFREDTTNAPRMTIGAIVADGVGIVGDTIGAWTVNWAWGATRVTEIKARNEARCEFTDGSDWFVIYGSEGEHLGFMNFNVYKFASEALADAYYASEGTTAASVTSGSISVRIRPRDAANNALEHNDERAYFHYADPYVSTNEWVQISYNTQPMPTDTDKCLFEIFLSGDFNGTVYFDDVDIVEYTIPEYSCAITYPTTKGHWYPGLHTDTVTVAGKIEASDSTYALAALETKAILYDTGDNVIQTLDPVAVGVTGAFTHTFTNQIVEADTGDWHVAVIIATAADHTTRASKTLRLTVHAALDTEPTTVFDSSGRLIVGGVTTFPLIAFLSPIAAHFNQLSSIGTFTHIMPWGTAYLPDTPGVTDFDALMDLAATNGHKVLVPLHLYTYGTVNSERYLGIIKAGDVANNNYEAVQWIVDAYKEKTALAGWYIADDEYDFNNTQIAQRYDYLDANDVYGIIWQLGHYQDNFYDRSAIMDAGGVYFYPIMNTNIVGKTLVTEFPKMYAGFLKAKAETTGRPLWFAMECSASSAEQEEVTNQLMALEATMAFIAGANGLAFYNVSKAITLDYDANMLTKFTSFMTKLNSLTKYFISTELTGVNAVTVAGAGLIYKTVSYNGKPYCFVANMTNAAIAATITFPVAANQIKSDNLIGSNVIKTSVANAVSESIEAYGSRLFSIYIEETGGGGTFTWDADGDPQTTDITSNADYTKKKEHTVNIYNATDKSVTVTFNLLDGATVALNKTTVLTNTTGKSIRIKGLFTTGTLRIIATPAAAATGDLTVNIY